LVSSEVGAFHDTAVYALRQLGGTLTVESAPGEGTALSAAIPLEPR
jgi:chemotaxis protein histidine kinase CheA